MRALSSTLILTAAFAAAAGPAAAQDRGGLFVGFGAGWGSAKISCDNCGDSEREGSITGQVRVGTTLSERLSVGAELNGWFDEENDDRASLFLATAAFYFYPAERGLFVKGGVGLARTDFEVATQTLSGMGLGVMAGAGYDFAIGTSTAITPTATVWYGKPGDLELDGIPVITGFSNNVFEVGVGITFY